MELLLPKLGLIIWTTVVFLIVFFILRKYAWKPILGAIKSREDSIEEALLSAEKARKEMANMQADNEKLLNEAREERSKMLKEAKATKESIIGEAREEAKKQASKILEEAKAELQNQQAAAMVELKNQAGQMAVEIAERLLRKELKEKSEQQAYMEKLVQEFNMN